MMGGKKKLMRFIRGEKRDTRQGSGFATNLSGHGTLSLERQAGTLLKMMAPTEHSISAYAHVHVTHSGAEDNSSSDDGFHTDAQHETDSDPGKDSLHDDDNIYENAYCNPETGGLKTNFIGSGDDFGPSLHHNDVTDDLSDDEHRIMGNNISSDMMTESEYATLPAITLSTSANRFKGVSENTTSSTLQKKKKPNVLRVKKPGGNRWAARISNDIFNRSSKKRGSSGRRKPKNGAKKILVLNDFSPSSSTTDPYSPIGSDSDSVDSGRCADTASLHSTGSSAHTTSADELDQSPTSSPPKAVKSHRRCPSISNISFSTINCHSPCGKTVPVIKVTPQKKLPSVDEAPETQLVNSHLVTEKNITNFNENETKDTKTIAVIEIDADIENNNNNKVFDVEDISKMSNKGESPRPPDSMQTRAPIYSVLHYVDHLKKQMSASTLVRTAAITKGPQIKDGISPLSYLLRKLKLDLKMSYDSFIDDFVATPHDGIGLLVGLLRDIQHFQQSGTTTRRSKLDQYKRSLTDEHDCLLCIKFSLRVQGAIEKLLDIRYGLETVTSCLLSSFSKARVTALEILTVSLSVKDGYSRVLDSMTHIRLKFGESVRFKLLVSMLNSQGSVYVLFQLVCMRFLNVLMACTGGQNARVFLQYELEMAGLDMGQLEKNAIGDGLEYDDLRREIDAWKRRYVDVQSLQDELSALQNRCSLLRHQVDSKEDKVKVLEETQAELEKQMNQLRESCNSYITQNTALQEALEKMKSNKKKHSKDTVVQDNISTKPETNSFLMAKTRNEKFQELEIAPETPSKENFIRPVIPPPPPLPTTQDVKVVRRTLSVEPKVRMPLLNWQPLTSVENTVFQAMDEDELYKELNLTEFERRFQLKPSESSTSASSPTQSGIFKTRGPPKVQILSADRMRNVVITKRKIGLGGPEIREYVDQFNMERLSGEFAELLLRFIPTTDEMKVISQHSAEFSKLGEAEQFLYHLGHIDNCKTKLTLMAYMGAFDDVKKTLTSQIGLIHKASISLLNSWKLRKLFQLILALGNYMNCQRRGVASGFRLESLTTLSEVKTADRQQTFLHYLTDLLESHYTSLLDWPEDLDISLPRSASYQSLLMDVKNLQRGLAEVRVAMEKHPDVRRLKEFYDRAAKELQEVCENFSQMEEFYEKACCTYGEKHTTIEPGEFFGHFSKFLKLYQKAQLENHRSSANSSAGSSPSHSPLSVGTPKQDFLTEAKRLMEKNSHRLASSRTLENAFSEMVKRKQQNILPSPIPTLNSGGQSRKKDLPSDTVNHNNDSPSKELVNNWILHSSQPNVMAESEDKFRTSTLKSTCGRDNLHFKTDTRSGVDSPPQSGLMAVQLPEPSPDYTNPNSPANTISNASEISRVLREFDGNINPFLGENADISKGPVEVRPVDFYRPVTFL